MLPSVIEVLSDWVANTAVASKLQNYQGIRCTMCVRIEHSGSPYSVGKRIWAFDIRNAIDAYAPTFTNPAYSIINTVGTRKPYQILATKPISASTSPHTAKSVELKMPYLFNANYYDKSEPEYGPLLLNAAAVDTYNIDGTSVTTYPYFTIYAWAEDLELVVPSRAQSSHPENAYRTVSKAVGAASEAARNIGFNTTPVDIAKKFGDAVATAMGYSKPSNPRSDNYISRFAISNTSTYNGDANEVPVVFGGIMDESPVDHGTLGFGDDRETTFASIGARYGYVGKQNINSTTNVSENVVLSIPVTPFFMSTGVADTFACTPAGYLAHLFARWYGEMEFEIEIVTNPYVKGSVRVEWDPNQPNYISGVQTSGLNVLPTVVCDTSATTVCTIRCPWSALAGTLETTRVGNVVNPFGTNGFINVIVQTPFQSNAGSAITLGTILVRSRVHDFRLFEFKNAADSTFYTNQPSRAQSSKGDLVGPMCFGTEITSVNQLLRISDPYIFRTSHTEVPAGTVQFCRTAISIAYVPPGTFSYYSGNSPQEQADQILNEDNGKIPLMVYLTPMFLARRGGTRAKVQLGGSSLDYANNTNTVNDQMVQRTTLDTFLSVATLAADYWPNHYLMTLMERGQVPAATDLATNLEFRMNRKSDYRYSDARFYTGATNGGAGIDPVSGVRFVSQRKDIRTFSESWFPSRLIVWWSGDDNFVVNGFWGVPELTLCRTA